MIPILKIITKIVLKSYLKLLRLLKNALYSRHWNFTNNNFVSTEKEPLHIT